MTDFLLVAWVSALIEFRRFAWMFGLGRRWTPGEKLRLLFAGYNGTRNTGSDVRVQEMLRQVRHVLGADNVDFSVMSQDFKRSAGLFRRHTSGPSARRFPAVPVPRGAAKSRRDRLRRLDVQEQIRQRLDHDDDRFAGPGFRGEQTLPGLRWRGRAHGLAWSRTCARATFTIRWSSPATSNHKRSSASSAFPPNSAPTPPGPSTPTRPNTRAKLFAKRAGTKRRRSS